MPGLLPPLPARPFARAHLPHLRGRPTWCIALLLRAVVGATASAQAAPTELLCGLRTGDSHAVMRVAPTRDPLASQRTDLDERFGLRVLALADPAQPDQVAQVVVTVLDTEADPAPVVLTQSRWLEGLPPPLASGERWGPRLTGWQRSYSPRLGRELAWGCAVTAAGATPPGWQDVDATASATALATAAPGPTHDRGIDTAAKPTAAVRMVWMGDIMLADGPGRLIAHGQDPFAAMAPLLKQADLRVGNLECVIASGGQRLHKPWTFRAQPRTLAVLRRHLDVVSLANNHSGDFGKAAFRDMLNRLDQAGLPYFGGGRDLRQANAPRIIERQGLRIALLGYNEMFPRQFEAAEQTPGTAWADEEQMVAAVTAARSRADVVIPYLHWGQEHEPQAHARQRALARRLIAAGADAVVGTHPHVRQDTEVIDGKPVIYSLGNFVFDGFSDEDNNTASLLWMDVNAQGVRRWWLQTVHIDRLGRPHPQTAASAALPPAQAPSGAD
jgi:poly-gamma-glutamate synthesis protein (capsule biosynthesis protein)